ncbi:hybrid sensor histidine kinase/response regulator [Pedobacter ginsengisoli]|uniref:histidine kinase n=1 Tax=Pedobacter ginsengisoli TaxID=363852 RepID=A0A2D1U8G5_9SPHI|nr:two-component regulator propeller domain-containing protein [Pedobacter ginsengisoli]ATP57893.1 hybrid sensor histidine kinase/response regulator [Pedobacter ginsengisoli]
MKQTILLLSFILVQLCCKGQELVFSHLMAEDGLSQNSIFAITQDSRGFMWYGSRFGLNRYDGIHFRLYKSFEADTTTLTDDYITTLHTDSKGILWVGTANGLNKFAPRKNSFERIYLLPPRTKPEPNFIRCIYEDKKKRLWVGTSNGLYLSVTGSASRFIYAEHLGLQKQIARGEILSLQEDAEGFLWIGTNAGLIKVWFDQQISVVNTFVNSKDPGSISDNSITGIIEDQNRDLWIATENGGLNLLRKNATSFTRFVHDRKNSNSLVHNAIRKMIKDKSGRLWIGTQEGISILDPDTKEFKTVQHSKSNRRSLNQNSTYSLYQDYNGSIWIGTYYGGVNVNYASSTNFKSWQHNEQLPGLNHNVVSSILEDNQDNLWMATEGGGLNYFNRATKKFGAYLYEPNNPRSLGSNLVKVIYKGRNQNLWVGTHGGGLNLFNPSQNNFRRFSINKSDINKTRSEIVAIFEDSDNVLWVGSQTGLRLFNQDNNELKINHSSDKLRLFGNKNIKVLFKDSRGEIWIATTTGLFLYSKKSNTLLSFKLPKGSNSVSTNSNYINCIQEDAKGNIWVGLYYGGLARYDAGRKFFTVTYTTKDGLSNNNVVGILEDAKHKLWISTSNGLSKFDPETKIFQTYSTSDGMAGDEFNYNSFFKSRNGELFFGGYNGVTHFFPNEIKKNEFRAPIVFTRLTLFNIPVAIGAFNGLLKEDISYTDHLQFKHNQNIFTIEFALLNYIKSNKNKYAYKLEGVNSQWVETNIPLATYTNLPSGTYKLLVKGANNDGVWSSPGSINIAILPPFWKQWWAFCIYAVLLSIILFFITRYFYLKQLLTKDEELHQIKLNFFMNVSHEIRTHLTLIMAPIEKILEGTQHNIVINKQLNTVKNNADRLLRLVSELMDFRKAETKNLKLKVASSDFIPFIRGIYSSFEELSIKRNIAFNLVLPIEEIIVSFDKEQLEKVFFNLISNAFKFTPKGGSITVRVNIQNDQVFVDIEDTGPGIAPEYLGRLFTNFFQVEDHHIQNTGYGIGLALAKNIVELHKGRIEVSSRVMTDNQQGYTNFTVTLQKENQHLQNASYLKDISSFNTETEVQKAPAQKMDSVDSSERIGVKHNRTILIAEDHPELQEMIKETLETDYHVIISKDGLEGWNRATEEIPDLIISDVMMPKMDGFTLCNHLKTDERTSHIPVILLTAKSSETDQISGLTNGADIYLTKPFSSKILQLHVNNLLQARETMRSKFSKLLLLEPSQAVVNPLDKEFLSKLITIVEDHMDDENLGVDLLSQKIGMSQSVLYKKLKALTDMSVNDFSKSIRLKRAAQLLKQKQYTVYEIGYMVGFTDRKYFSREFKKQFGKTPSEYI